ncbi:molybdopterin-binding protein [Flindersiella endophytica]
MEITKRRRLLGGGAGILAVAAGLGVSYGLASALSVPSPIESVGTWAIDLAPAAVKDYAVSTFGTADKPLLLVGLLVGIACLAAVAGAIGVRRPRAGAAIAGGFGVVGLAAAAFRPASGGFVVRMVPALTAAVIVVGALAVLLHLLREEPRTEAPQPGGFDRRRFLVTALAVGAAGAAGGLAGRTIAGTAKTPATLRIPAPAGRAPAVDEAAVGVEELRRVTPFFTRNADFYRVDVNLSVPRVDPATWRLRIHGMVERELELDFAQLVDRRLVERDITLTCVSNEVGGPYVGNARWTGVPLAELLSEAGLKDGADAVRSTAVDGFTIGTPLQALTDGRDALVAVAMNGRPLPAEHGFPARMVVPGLYGYVSATKWLVDLEVTRFEDFEAYWTKRGWAARAPIKTSSRIDTPRPLANLRSGKVAVAGVAWAQHRGVAKVEVRVDGGAWNPARLAAQDTLDTWRQWVWQWDATPGNHTLEVRATDRTGAVQVERRVPPRPNGSSGWHNVTVLVA